MVDMDMQNTWCDEKKKKEKDLGKVRSRRTAGCYKGLGRAEDALYSFSLSRGFGVIGLTQLAGLPC